MDNTALVGFLLALLLRWIVSIHPHSGQGKPPLFGDYEAQRHWMEITVNLPPSQWYENSTENDLLYWGLDYPPLTAYHSYALGKIAQFINPEWVQLNTSRGYESYHHKIFMRSTVFISDFLIYASALFYYWNTSLIKVDLRSTYFLRSLIAPAIILIDYGHFQYNSFSLGLILWTVVLLKNQKDVLASVVFCLALNYKQMSLYYSLPIFFYLLARCASQKTFLWKTIKLAAISLTVLFTFSILWLPYLSDVEAVLQVIRRIFPLNRGIYEDKVANFWYCLSIAIKVKKFFNESQLAAISALLTLSFSLPSCFMLFKRNTIDMLKYSLVNVALTFFLFSFQVHEKTILFVTSVLLLLNETNPFAVFWFEIIATFSLQPLLIKDDLMIPYFALTVIYIAIGYGTLLNNDKRANLLFAASILGCVSLSIAALTVNPPSRFPHIHILLNCLYSFLHFAFFLLFFIYKQFNVYRQTAYISSGMTKLKQK